MTLPETSLQKLQIKFFALPAAWAILIFISSSIPGTSLPPLDIWSADKFIHSAVYAVLAFFSGRAFIHYAVIRNKSINRFLAWSAFFCLLYGASDEFHQMFVPNRYASFFDLLADAIGIFVVHFYFWVKK